jgi:hypothetical protein
MKKVNFLWAAISLVLVSAIGFTGLLTSCSFFMFGTSNAEKLGFPKGKKVLLLHMDDAGMCEEANEAVRYYIENGYLQSASSWKPANKPGKHLRSPQFSGLPAVCTLLLPCSRYR